MASPPQCSLPIEGRSPPQWQPLPPQVAVVTLLHSWPLQLVLCLGSEHQLLLFITLVNALYFQIFLPEGYSIASCTSASAFQQPLQQSP